jgi:riboflavin transporter FmnP
MRVKLATVAVALVQFVLAYFVALPIFLLFKLARTLLRRDRRGQLSAKSP